MSPYADELKESILTEDDELNQLVDQALSLLDRTDSVFIRADFESIELRNSTERKLRHILRKIGQAASLKISSPPSDPRLEVRRKQEACSIKNIKLVTEDT